jgi:iron complex outermembrane receptor protein
MSNQASIRLELAMRMTAGVFMTTRVEVPQAGLRGLPVRAGAPHVRSAVAMVLAGALVPGASALAAAADDAKQQFEEITVTAKKVEQGIYDVPVAISAFSAKELEARHADNLMDVGNFVPNLNITSFGAGNTSAQMPFIRGIGVQDHLIVVDPGVGVYIDGVYLGRQIGQNLDLNNIERLEVLRGPQGTLFGRNSIGGAINIITRKPGAEETARFTVQAGSRTRVNGDFYLNSKLSDTFAVSASATVKHRDGLGKFVNVPNSKEDVGEQFNTSGRLAASWTPSERFSLLLSADGSNDRDGLAPYRTLILESPGNLAYDGGLRNSGEAANPYNNNTGQAGQVETTASSYGVGLTAQGVLTDNLTGKLITSYRSSNYTGGLDDDGQIVDFYSYPEHGHATQHSVEAQLNGKFDQLDFVTGVFFFDEEGANIQRPVTFASFPDGYFEQNQRTLSTAVYGNVGYQITPAFRLSGGARYTHDKKHAYADLGFAPPFSDDRTWSQPTWEVSGTYKLAPLLTAYATISRGYQSGGYPARPYGGAGTFKPYNPVTATDYEVGIKGEPLPFLQEELTLFDTEYKDLTAQVSEILATGFSTITENAGRARSYGVEWESRARLVEGFFFNTSIGYDNAKYTQVKSGSSLKVGDTPALTPKWTISAGPEYRLALLAGGSVAMRVDYSYRSAMEGQPNNDPLAKIGSRYLVNFDVTYTAASGGWTVGAYGKNVTDQRYVEGKLDVGDYVLNLLSNDASEFGLRFTKTLGK